MDFALVKSIVDSADHWGSGFATMADEMPDKKEIIRIMRKCIDDFERSNDKAYLISLGGMALMCLTLYFPKILVTRKL